MKLKTVTEFQTELTEETARGVSAGKRDDPRGAAKKVVTAPTPREVVREMVTRGLSERRALAVVA